MRISPNQKRLGCGLLCAFTMLAVARARPPAASPPAAYEVYYERVPLRLTLFAPRVGQRHFAFGPWQLGARLRQQRGDDRHPNLYLVVPGRQHSNLDGGDEWDHNAVLGTLPMILLFFFLQRAFIQGIAATGLKE